MFNPKKQVAKKRKLQQDSDQSDAQPPAAAISFTTTVTPSSRKRLQVTSTAAAVKQDGTEVIVNPEETIFDHPDTTKTGPTHKQDRPAISERRVHSGQQIDLQQNMCKDFYETGYCGFGDSCKFLHQRPSEGLSAWEKNEPTHEKSGAEDPGTCGSCGQTWDDCTSPPCRTNCGHFFCEACFFADCVKTCKKCGKNTEGVCHAADHLLTKISEI